MLVALGSIITIKSLVPILPNNFNVYGIVIPTTELREIPIRSASSPSSSISSTINPSPSNSFSSAISIKTLDSLRLQTWLMNHLSSHLKHKPFARFSRYSSSVNLFSFSLEGPAEFKGWYEFLG